MHEHDPRPRLVGRSSSHFTRLARLFAGELGVACTFVPVHDLASRDPADYAGNPALKLPVLVLPEGPVFGAENICHALAALAPAALRIAWTGQLPDLRARNAQELIWHGMGAQVQLVFGMQVACLPAENLYFAKAADGFRNALAWLDANLEAVLQSLPPRDLSLLEASLFCLIEHVAFRDTLPVAPYRHLVAFADAFRERPAAQATAYAFDVAMAH
ncbi:glutathione S-transferase N-terminal domain-containing protein [Frateuria sp.]|uniref:glutathione S-transferase N-terminal domain-containing protein n=1 Tax=Frateuria sp. TaxID=2211372 RepID=UPI001821B6BE|nr:glutathione S-transferase N-terminal domain-containing protein [Frateuria sp.]NUR23691.1 glutathione S-transferase family protein [Frateuria sp.]